jgi:hypothetical protein
MTDQLLQAIEARLAERRKAKFATWTDEHRVGAMTLMVRSARNGDWDAKERVEKLLAAFPQFGEWVAEQMALGQPVPEKTEPQQRVATSSLDISPTSPRESVREMTFRQAQEATDAPATPLPEPPKREWYESGHKPGLQFANQLKKLFSPKPEPGDGWWMNNR